MPEYIIRYEGSPLSLSPLINMLHDDGVEAYVEQTRTESGVAEVAATIVVSIVASGAYDVIKAGVRNFRERYSNCSAEIDDNAKPYRLNISDEQRAAFFAEMNEFMDRRPGKERYDRSDDEA